MITRDYFELFRYLMEQRCLMQEDLVFVEDISAWCREQGINEPDRYRPFSLVSKDEGGCRILVREDIPDGVIEQRINAMRIRGQLRNVAFDRADMLNSAQKKLAYLFLSEYALSLPEIGSEELLADDWVFEEMERMGFFKV